MYWSFEAYLKDSDRGPQDVIKMFSVTFTLGMIRYDLRASTVPLGAIVFDELAKLTTEQVHAQNTAW